MNPRAMARLWYFILRNGGEWKISFGVNFYGPYEDADHAFHTAVSWAQAHGNEGHDTRVVLQEDDGEFVVLWTYGDPYPVDR